MRGIAILLHLLIPLLLLAEAVDREAQLTKYCFGCHSQRAKMGGLVLESVPVKDPAARPEVWEKVVRKVKAGEMPPVGMPTPGEPSLKAFATELARDLDTAARRTPYAGQPLVRRLNRTEYANAIADLLA